MTAPLDVECRLCGVPLHVPVTVTTVGDRTQFTVDHEYLLAHFRSGPHMRAQGGGCDPDCECG